MRSLQITIFICLFAFLTTFMLQATPPDTQLIKSELVSQAIAGGEKLSQAADEKPTSSPGSGLLITTTTKVIGGMVGTPAPATRTSLRFAVAPFVNDQIVSENALKVNSDNNGELYLQLEPGKYWIGPAERLSGDNNYNPKNFEIRAVITEVVSNNVKNVHLEHIRYAP